MSKYIEDNITDSTVNEFILIDEIKKLRRELAYLTPPRQYPTIRSTEYVIDNPSDYCDIFHSGGSELKLVAEARTYDDDGNLAVCLQSKDNAKCNKDFGYSYFIDKKATCNVSSRIRIIEMLHKKLVRDLAKFFAQQWSP